MELRVLHAPLKAPLARQYPDRIVARVRELRPTYAGFTEAYGIIPALRRAPGGLVLEDGGKDARRGQKDNPILVRAGLRSVGRGQVLIAEQATPVEIAPERWLTYSVDQLPGRPRPHCHVQLHLHAGVQGDKGGIERKADRGREFIRSVDALDAFLAFAKAMSWIRSVAGDVNVRDIGKDPKLPHLMLRQHGLVVHDQGLDLIAGDKALRLDVDEVKAPAGVTDHPWLLGVSS